MPIYDVYHVFQLSMAQKDQLAQGLTDIHANTFTTPKLFVNVIFHDDTEKYAYVAGKRKNTNRIIATVRSGPARSKQQYDDVCIAIGKLWNETVAADKEELEGHPRRELRAIFILGSMIGGAEAGFILPEAGEDRGWLERNMATFKDKADAGDEDFSDMLVDVKHRKGFEGLVGEWKSAGELAEEKEARKKHKEDVAENGPEPDKPADGEAKNPAQKSLPERAGKGE